MFKIRIVALGKFKEKAFLELEREYLKRLNIYAKIKVIELAEVPYRKNDLPEKIKEKEAESIINICPRRFGNFT